MGLTSNKITKKYPPVLRKPNNPARAHMSFKEAEADNKRFKDAAKKIKEIQESLNNPADWNGKTIDLGAVSEVNKKNVEESGIYCDRRSLFCRRRYKQSRKHFS